MADFVSNIQKSGLERFGLIPGDDDSSDSGGESSDGSPPPPPEPDIGPFRERGLRPVLQAILGVINLGVHDGHDIRDAVREAIEDREQAEALRDAPARLLEKELEKEHDEHPAQAERAVRWAKNGARKWLEQEQAPQDDREPQSSTTVSPATKRARARSSSQDQGGSSTSSSMRMAPEPPAEVQTAGPGLGGSGLAWLVAGLAGTGLLITLAERGMEMGGLGAQIRSVMGESEGKERQNPVGTVFRAVEPETLGRG